MRSKHKTRAFPHRVGLDVGSHSVKGVEVLQRASEPVVCSAGASVVAGTRDRHEALDRSATVQAIRSLWSTAKFATSKVVLSLPTESVYTKWLHLEASDAEQLDLTARTAATRGAPFPPDSAIVDYRVLSSHGKGSTRVHFVMLIAAAAAAVDDMLSIAESAGLEPLAVEMGAAGALRSFEARRRATNSLWSGQPLAHCILGARDTTIAVVRNGEMEFARSVPVGGHDFTECIAQHCQVDWAEAEAIKTTPGSRLIESGTLIASHEGQEVRIPCDNVVGRLAREITRSLRFFASQFAEGSYLGMIGTTTVSGGGALLKGLGECLEEQGVEISAVTNPFSGLSVDAEGGVLTIGETAAQYATAVGLALGDYWSEDPAAVATEAAA